MCPLLSPHSSPELYSEEPKHLPFGHALPVTVKTHLSRDGASVFWVVLCQPGSCFVSLARGSQVRRHRVGGLCSGSALSPRVVWVALAGLGHLPGKGHGHPPLSQEHCPRPGCCSEAESAFLLIKQTAQQAVLSKLPSNSLFFLLEVVLLAQGGVH